jgi:hypothetical protein
MAIVITQPIVKRTTPIPMIDGSHPAPELDPKLIIAHSNRASAYAIPVSTLMAFLRDYSLRRLVRVEFAFGYLIDDFECLIGVVLRTVP